MLYTVKNLVVENNQLVYNDGVTNLFLYTEGKIGGSDELSHLLNHISHTTRDNAIDPDLKQIQDIVDAIKSDKKVGERYMTFEEIFGYEKRDSYNEGMEAGMDVGIQALIEVLQEANTPMDKIKSKLLSKFNISETNADELLKKYYK